MCAALVNKPFDYECDTITNFRIKTELGTMYAPDMEGAVERVKRLYARISEGKISRVRVEPRWPENPEQPPELIVYPTLEEIAVIRAQMKPQIGPLPPCTGSESSSSTTSETCTHTSSTLPISTPLPLPAPSSASHTGGSSTQVKSKDLWSVAGLCFYTNQWMKEPEPLATSHVLGKLSKKEDSK